ncbi:MAG TPA: ferritin family protein [Kofleriaceae bacterium]|nr:ferritin family protein [Kofleriaceae bacterium]
MTPRQAVVRLVTPLVWRLPGHGARKLYGFARAEQASRIDLLLAAQRTDSLRRRGLYLRHAIDETRHAAMFWRRSSELRSEEQRAPFTPPVADTEDLFERLGERRFLAFVHRGERRGREQFELYARHFGERGDARTCALFEAILSDERRHESYTRALLVELAGGERAARAELRRAALWEAWRIWRRAGRALAGAIYTLAMAVIYVVTGPFAALGLRALRRPAGWQLLGTSGATTGSSLAAFAQPLPGSIVPSAAPLPPRPDAAPAQPAAPPARGAR